MSRLTDLVINNPLCATKETIDFVKGIDNDMKQIPSKYRQLIENDILKAFEKGLILGLHHFNEDNFGQECEE